MSRKKLALITLAALASAAFLVTRPAVGNGAAPGYSTDVQITKSEKTAGAYAVRVQVRDLATGDLVAAPQILARAGAGAEAEMELSEHSACKVAATVDPTTKTATYSIVVTQAGATIAEHKAKITIE